MLGPCFKGTLFQVRWAYTARPLTTQEQAVFDGGGSLPAGVGQDPTTVEMDYLYPGGVETTVAYPAQVNREAAGIYHYNLDTTPAAGAWNIRTYSTGTNQAAVEDILSVLANFAGPEV